jgi:hypothetical protein
MSLVVRSEETFFLLALLLKRRALREYLLLSHVLMRGRLERPCDKLLSRVLGHMPASGATDRPEWSLVYPASGAVFPGDPSEVAHDWRHVLTLEAQKRLNFSGH